MDDYDQNGGDDSYGSSYNAKIMFASGAILVSACIAVVLFHLFIRRRTRRADPLADHHLPRRRLSVLLETPAAAVRQGLDARVLNSIPTFTYDPKAHETPLVCAVCLSEFEDGETGRVLPKCEHCFHLDCIGTWLRTHGDCPLCRARVRVSDRVRVEPSFQDARVAITTVDDKASPENGSSVVVSISEAEADDRRERGVD